MPTFCELALPVPARSLFTYRTGAWADSLRPGQRVRAPFGRRQVTGFVVRLSDRCDLPGDVEIREISGPVDKLPLLDEKLLALAQWLARYYRSGPGEALAALLAASLTPPAGQPVEEEAWYQPDLPGIAERRLNPGQEAALEEISAAIGRPGSRPVLLRGVISSGKTDLYLHLARRAEEKGFQSLLLVPEIALTAQVGEWAADYFGDRAAVLHSRLARVRHYRLIEKARAGEIPLVIGTRSAVFTPLRRCGLIMVDEEFDSSYKEIKAPRYHARETAVRRAEIEGALAVLGTATPSLEAWHRARTGEYRAVNLETRVGQPERTRVHVLDLRSRPGRKKRSRGGLVPDPLRSMIEERLLRGEQVIILVNRRGSTSRLVCRTCGETVKCPGCLVSAVFHRSTGLVECHYCGTGVTKPAACPSCASADFTSRSVGAAAVAAEVEKKFPGVSVLRAESATLQGEEGLRMLRDFRDGRHQVMVGTRLVTKGHHFPGVTLAAVLGGDYLLDTPDFRAAENTFQTLSQLAGRAGRCLPGAEMVIQTYHPENYAIRAVAEGEDESFYERELAFRLEAGYPPCGRLANILFTGRRDKSVRLKAEECRRVLAGTELPAGLELLGPAPCRHRKIRGLYRWHMLLRAPDAGSLAAALEAIPDSLLARGTVLDVDPIDTA